MNHLIAIVSLLFSSGSVQAVSGDKSVRLEGAIVRYDAEMSARTSQADFVVKLNANAGKKYVRLRYSPHGFGFDAPLAKPEQLVPKAAFSSGNVVWVFKAHTPRNPEERSACTGRLRRYAPRKDGKLMKVERFTLVPGSDTEITPKPELLPCLILESLALKDK